MLVQTRNLPHNLPEVYIEGINTITKDDRDDDEDDNDNDDDDDDGDDDDDDDSEDNEEHYRLQELKIRVYNHTVEFKRKRRLAVSVENISNSTLPLTHFPVAPSPQTQYFVHGIISYFCPPTSICESAEGNNQLLHISTVRCYNSSEADDVLCAMC